MYLTFMGICSGLCMGVTSIPPTGIDLLLLDYFQHGAYRKLLGTIMVLNLLPITIGSAIPYVQRREFDYKLGVILFVTMVIGSYFGSQLVLSWRISIKTIKYITAFECFVLAISFFISAYYETK